MIKKGYFLILLILFMVISVHAQNDDVFSSNEKIIAPPLPPEEGKEVTEKADVIFELRDYETKELIRDIHADLYVYDSDGKLSVSTIKYVGSDGLLKVRMYNGNYDIILRVDNIDSSGMDYFIKFDQTVNGNTNNTAYLLSVGSVIGSVYDFKGRVVNGAHISFVCSGNYGEKVGEVSDDFGSFSSYWLPVGACRIAAISGNDMGYKDVEIKKGELSRVDVVLDKGVKPRLDMIVIIIMIAIITITGFFLVKYVNKKERKSLDKKETEIIEEKGLSSRTRDLMKTLKEKELNVVNFLLENNNKSTQAKIRYGTGIPKTSLARIFVSLELKKAVRIETIGKLKKIELTGWFLGKD